MTKDEPDVIEKWYRSRPLDGHRFQFAFDLHESVCSEASLGRSVCQR